MVRLFFIIIIIYIEKLSLIFIFVFKKKGKKFLKNSFLENIFQLGKNVFFGNVFFDLLLFLIKERGKHFLRGNLTW